MLDSDTTTFIKIVLHKKTLVWKIWVTKKKLELEFENDKKHPKNFHKKSKVLMMQEKRIQN